MIPHADALSRHVGTVLHDENLNSGLFRLEQAKDSFCKDLKTGTYTDKCEFFLDDIDLIYSRGADDKHRLIVPESLIQNEIKQNHDPVHIGHPGVKRTCDHIALSFWWPGMRKSIEDHVKTCDACQRIRGGREFKAPLGKVEIPTAPFQVTSMDFTGPFRLTQRRNRYILSFVDHFSRYTEAFAVPDQSAQTCARICATEILARHGTGSKLITDHGPTFMSAFFNETCKVMGISRARTPLSPILKRDGGTFS